MVDSTNPGWIQTAFDTLIGLFDQVGLKKNVKKSMGVVCHPCRADGVRADKAYIRRMMGEGRSYKERQRGQVNYPECGKDLVRGSLSVHLQNNYGVYKGVPRQEGDGEYGYDDTKTYKMKFPAKAGPRP